jgi:hypothetical protein
MKIMRESGTGAMIESLIQTSQDRDSHPFLIKNLDSNRIEIYPNTKAI